MALRFLQFVFSSSEQTFYTTSAAEREGHVRVGKTVSTLASGVRHFCLQYTGITGYCGRDRGGGANVQLRRFYYLGAASKHGTVDEAHLVSAFVFTTNDTEIQRLKADWRYR